MVRGSIFNKLGDLPAATDNFQKAVDLDPNKAEPLELLGAALAAQKRFAQAEDLFRRAIAQNQRLAEAHLNLSMLLLQTKKQAGFDEAMREARLAVALDNGNPQAHVNYGHLLAISGHLDEAIAQLQLSLQINPNQPTIRILLKDLKTRASHFGGGFQ
jgi:superkiller protein 3